MYVFLTQVQQCKIFLDLDNVIYKHFKVSCQCQSCTKECTQLCNAFSTTAKCTQCYTVVEVDNITTSPLLFPSMDSCAAFHQNFNHEIDTIEKNPIHSSKGFQVLHWQCINRTSCIDAQLRLCGRNGMIPFRNFKIFGLFHIVIVIIMGKKINLSLLC